MNKLLSLLVVSFLLVSVKLASAANVQSWSIKEITATSDTIKGSCYVKAVYLSTPTDNATASDWAVLIASPLATPSAPFSAYTSAQKISPALVFTSSSVATGTNYFGAYKAIDYGDEGIFVSTDCTLWKSKASSGEAYKAFIQYRK